MEVKDDNEGYGRGCHSAGSRNIQRGQAADERGTAGTAKLLLESILTGETDDETHWSAMSLDTFQRDWDNAEDAIYDNWRELFCISGQTRRGP